MLIAASVGASQGSLNIVLVGVIGWAAAVLGDNTGYAIGRFGGRRLVLAVGKYVFITHKRLDYAEGLFRKRGAIVVIIARFVEILRQLNGIIAGVAEMHWLKFLLYNSIGAALWVGVWSTLVFVLGKQAKTFHVFFQKFEYILLAAIAVGFVVWIVFHRRAKKRERALSAIGSKEEV
ncbi:MAG TPA: DedA family protein [Spirochaetia bacterium]|nr:DedA family protein [Spirochaetia bacterium]